MNFFRYLSVKLSRPNANEVAKELLLQAQRDAIEAGAALVLASDQLASAQASVAYCEARVARLTLLVNTCGTEATD